MKTISIFEIGPIGDYLASTRKLKDLWGGSFLFSYLMGCIAKTILEKEIKGFDSARHQDKVQDVIFRPNLANNTLFEQICLNKELDVKAGSIPDQLFCQTNDDEKSIQKEFERILVQLFEKTKNYIKKKHYVQFEEELDKVAESQLTDYFRLFFITAECNPEEWNEHYLRDAENAISMRSEIVEFDDFSNAVDSVLSKKEKCSLCGDKKSIVTLAHAKRGGMLGGKEKLCAVCLLKRFTLETLVQKNTVANFESTTSIAALPVKKILKSLLSDEKSEQKTLKQALLDFANAHFGENGKTIDNGSEFQDFSYTEESGQTIQLIAAKEAQDELDTEELMKLKELVAKESFSKLINHLSYQLYFSDVPASRRFRKTIEDEIKRKWDTEKFNGFKKTNIQTLQSMTWWLQHGYYCILTCDGDDMGNVLKRKNSDQAALSRGLLTFTESVINITNDYEGRLIYCGGDDVLAIIHPLYLLEIAKDLNEAFKNALSDDQAHLSIGASICHHKYPLSLALKTASEMLSNVAKNQKDKATLAATLIKGGSTRCQFFCKIDDSSLFDIQDFIDLASCDLPRGFVYKISEEKDTLEQVLQTPEEIKKYIRFIYEKSGKEDKQAWTKIEKIFDKLIPSEANTDWTQMLHRLYFARFIQGESL
ncbi:MAG TPA: type III-B CRISPR-associated protein Cas10/Cmr2 [bacterium]|nr:type III-B CRISPR-associated protein Cas10/Cmr2 [bacterium]HPG46050.1 type III-B CRISPR-associated protein Cas10/Cmr2 [bacterium]HPM97872.1 type III-B CRISPR-associated protein Cas10/Cmr2 [bacterium]